MKSATYLFLTVLLSVFCFSKSFSQVKTYDAQWKKVDELIQKKNLPKSALEEVQKIYAQAKKDKQEAQVIKALVYTISLQQENRENNQLQAIKEVEKEIAVSKEPVTSILKSLEADLYWQYFQQHRWQLYDRTNTMGFNKEDIATWTLEDFHKKISDLYLQSIKNQSLLQNTRLEPFDVILIKGNVRYLRPTLFDLLAHRALNYFKNNERDIQKPAYAFEIAQPQAFAPAATFAKYKFATKDSLSLQYKTLLVYQDLVAFHLQDKNPDALIDVDIDRIEYVHNNSVNEAKDSLYADALEHIIQQYAGNKATYQASYLLAAYYNQLASQYNPLKDTAYRYDRIKAKNILEKIVADSSLKNEGWTNSYNLLQQINHPSFSFQVEKVNVPAQAFRALVKYKNVPALNFRLIKADEDLKKRMETNKGEENYWSILVKAPVIKSWQQTLPATNDLQEHSTEIKIDALSSVGEYFLLASTDVAFDKKNNPLAVQLFYTSNISYVNQGNQFFVLHRQSGQPLARATAQVFQQEYDYKTYKYTKTKIGTYQTDKNGHFTVDKNKDKRSYNYYVDVAYENDRLSLNEPFYNYYYYDGSNDNKDDETKKIFFFTDRSIYRPGQTVYFKGIAVTKNKQGNSVAAGYQTKIFLENANSEDVDSISVTTNEFGSFSGKFQLPQNLLNGEFRIYEDKDDNEVRFSVEEYKRPKFYVDFEKIKQGYKVDETVTVTGTAKAYAGNTIDGAKVVYRVVRQPRFIYTWLVRKWLPPVQPMEIAHGETTTDKEGKFSIQFTTIPDKKIDPKLDPVFDYKIYADVTDMNGETRSGENLITAGYKSLLLKTNLPERMAVDSFKTISIRTENMNGEYQPSMVTVTLSKLIPEQRLIRQRYWQQPDQFVMSKEEFISYFPHDEYYHESDYKTWPKGEIVVSQTDSTKVNGQWSMVNSSLSPGYYEITIVTKDKDGKEIKDVQYMELFNPSTNQFNKPEYLWTKGTGKAIEPGETTKVQIGSSANDVYLISQVNKPKEDNQFFFTQLSNEKKTFDYTAKEADRGGYGVNYFFVKDNRFYQFGEVVNVPWTNKELSIEFATFRDKTLPGSEEQWKVKITGDKNEKVAAEMLASMYDASLDQFKPHSWEKPSIWPVFAQTMAWNEEKSFSAVESQEKYIPDVHRTYFNKIYDEIIFNLSQQRAKHFLEREYKKGYIIKEMEDKSIRIINQEGMRDEGVAAMAAPRKVEMAKFTPPVIKKDVEVTDTTMAVSTEKVSHVPDFQPRKNFNETAFFFPELRTDKDGAIEFSFTVPEALTKWKLQTLAHTKDLAFGLAQKEMITQKDLMVQPNAPRFLRQGDHMEFTTKIVNVSDKELTGQVQLELLDAATHQSVDGWFMNTFPNQYFTVAAGQSEVVQFPIQVPYQFNNALVWRVTARAENLSDAEENILPVLTNKVLVTETLPLPMRGSGTKTFTFDKLLQSGESETLQNQSLTVEYTSNPAWYAVQALPYLMEYPYECAEQTWNRYYANALASKIVQAAPRIKQIFEQWKTIDTAALLSNLQKNQELKSALLEETPWVLQAKTEEQQKKNVAMLFDMVRMNNELQSNLEKLRQMQSPNGGFVWFKGGPDDRYITQYIATGMGHLKKLNGEMQSLAAITKTAIAYLDKKIQEDYEKLLKSKADVNKQQIGYLHIQYLYMRSFFPEYGIPKTAQTAYNYYRKQAQKFWIPQNKYMQGMIALALHRSGDKQTPLAILQSLKQTAITNEETGMYWKDNSFGYSWFWWYAPIETQSLLIEAFAEISNDTKTVDDLRTWLIKNKQTNNWRTTKATADACYAMLLQGSDWLSNEPVVQIKLGNTVISNTTEKAEAGTGYFKKTIDGKFVKPEMGTITVNVQQPINPSTNQPLNSPSWGAVYWQYFEDMDKVTTASTPLQLTKKLFIEKNTDRGPVLAPVEQMTELHVGDKIKVRIELRADRDMEYVHMKDLRASALEPVNVLSGYKWQGGLGYYESTKDASTNFFFNYLRKGTYVFEYPLFVTHAGTFSNGITTIQCMYAPEFSAHSEGIKITASPTPPKEG